MIDCPDTIYKITTKELYEKSSGYEYLVTSDADKDFIHFSEENDVDRIISKFFQKEEEVFVLQIDPKNLMGKLVKEKNPGGKKEYYHLYDGNIPKNSIKEIEVVKVSK